MNDYRKMLSIAAETNIPVMILGESGSGKEIAAKTLHQNSERKSGPFIALNCGAIPKTLAESILEGTERGAFTGAVNARPGVVRAASSGTLFLDEIGELPLESQARLLRILQEKKVLPVGAHTEIPVDFRLVCATHRNLPHLVRQGLFREDLYFRLNVFPIRLPPLRERKQEFSSIAKSVWQDIESEHLEKSPRPLTLEEIASLKSFEWPGNIRQLKNILQRYRLLAPEGISLEMLLNEERANGFESPRSLLRAGRDERKRAPVLEIIRKTVYECQNNKSEAARKLGISRGSLCYHLRRNYSEI